ncbi:MAG: hypothetical protein EBZ69_07530 [Alphaproteobacteria bacterium]|nr:hypothetical protein [Alphaproteobacteria bacterium]
MINANQAIAFFTPDQAQRIKELSDNAFEFSAWNGSTYYSPADFLSGMFVWGDTPEGHTYWQSVGARADLRFTDTLYDEGGETIVTLFDIVYDTDDEEVDGLPVQMAVTARDLGYEEGTEQTLEDYVAEHGADYVSDATGWAVIGFTFEITK